MEEIKVGEYVRTINQGIKKIDDINENAPVNRYKYKTGESDWDGEWYGTIKTTEIVKHSFNIIDLIEVGDYVNGYKIVNIEKEYYNLKLDEVLPLKTPNLIVGNEEGILSINKIKTIVTKEQFKSIEYEV